MVPSYGEGIVDHVAQGIGNAVKDILEKRVIRCVVMCDILVFHSGS